MSMMLPAVRGVQEERAAQAAEKRAAEALLDGMQPDMPKPEEDEENEETMVEVDASFTASTKERLKTLDFEQMSTAEIVAAKRMLSRLTLPVKPIASRRTKASHLMARVDPARTLRAAMRQGGEFDGLRFKKQRIRWPNLIVLCDISGSMSQYSRMVCTFFTRLPIKRVQGGPRCMPLPLARV